MTRITDVFTGHGSVQAIHYARNGVDTILNHAVNCELLVPLQLVQLGRTLTFSDG